ADFVVALANYAFSKRTDAYFGVDHTKVRGGEDMYLDRTSKARSRTGITAGLRHRF
ncbi:MAG: porin, partial [Comamonadaceae bacterium]|nr:porin [Comamonadaceae bacterium]